MNSTPIEALGAVPLIAPALVDETFDTWNGGQWLAGNHPLGRGWVRSGNVSVQGGQLLLGLPAGTLDGGEILSSRRVRYGSYEARLKSSAAPGSITAFFLYEGARTGNDEIDIEIPGGTRRILFTVWTRGRQVHHRELTLAFDPWTEFHDYRIEHGRRAVRFFVDGVEQVEFAGGLPSSQMHVMANAWWPVWLQGGPYGSDHSAALEWIRY
jgi:endo-1,3-1,4-beta-glycanase ExoK